MSETEDYRIVVVPEPLRPSLEAWLADRGLEMRRSPVGWIIRPTNEAMARGDWSTLR